MNQIFHDHLPFILGGLIIGLGLLAVARQTKAAKRMSWTVFVLACTYPCAIVALFMSRRNLGESYAYLIFGDLIAILLAVITGILMLIWIPVYVIGVRKKGDHP
jgi:formate/nitrite transporter FocA (FNT family)